MVVFSQILSVWLFLSNMGFHKQSEFLTIPKELRGGGKGLTFIWISVRELNPDLYM